MERTNKATFIARSNRKIEMYETFNKAIDVIISLAKEWDGKKMNKRFVDKVMDKLRDNHISYVRFGFDTRWDGNRDTRFKLSFDNRWVEEVNAYIDDTENMIFAHKGDYLDKDDFRLNAENFIGALNREKEILDAKIQELKECISNVDEIINKYAQMQKFVKETMDTIPILCRNIFQFRVRFFKKNILV